MTETGPSIGRLKICDASALTVFSKLTVAFGVTARPDFLENLGRSFANGLPGTVNEIVAVMPWPPLQEYPSQSTLGFGAPLHCHKPLAQP